MQLVELVPLFLCALCVLVGRREFLVTGDRKREELGRIMFWSGISAFLVILAQALRT